MQLNRNLGRKKVLKKKEEELPPIEKTNKDKNKIIKGKREKENINKSTDLEIDKEKIPVWICLE